MGTAPEDGVPFDLGARFDAAGIPDGHLLALHLVLRSSAVSATPILLGLTGDAGCESVVE